MNEDILCIIMTALSWLAIATFLVAEILAGMMAYTIITGLALVAVTVCLVVEILMTLKILDFD